MLCGLQASQSSIFSQFTLSVVATTSVLSLSRIMAHWKYYHSPMSVAFALEATEVPRLLNTTGHIVLPPQFDPKIDNKQHNTDRDEDYMPRIDMSLIQDWGLRLCVGKEWYRFPGHFLVPDGVRVDWVKSEFDGMLPGHFAQTPQHGGLLERLKGTMVVPKALNDLNKEAREFYVSVPVCADASKRGRETLTTWGFSFFARRLTCRHAITCSTWISLRIRQRARTSPATRRTRRPGSASRASRSWTRDTRRC